MNRDQVMTEMRSVLHQIAPEADLDAVEPGDEWREALDLDSMDFLNFIVGLHERTGVDIPERDYPRLATVGGCVDYVVERSA